MGAIYYVLFALLIVLVIAFAAWVMFGQRHMDKIIVLGVDIGMITLCMVLLILCVVLRNKYSFRELNPDYVSENVMTVSGGDVSGGDALGGDVPDGDTLGGDASDVNSEETEQTAENH